MVARSGLPAGVACLEMLASGRDGIIAQYVGFQFDLVKSMFENVADANNSHKLIAFLDGQMANASLRHELHHMGDAILG